MVKQVRGNNNWRLEMKTIRKLFASFCPIPHQPSWKHAEGTAFSFAPFVSLGL